MSFWLPNAMVPMHHPLTTAAHNKRDVALVGFNPGQSLQLHVTKSKKSTDTNHINNTKMVSNSRMLYIGTYCHIFDNIHL